VQTCFQFQVGELHAAPRPRGRAAGDDHARLVPEPREDLGQFRLSQVDSQPPLVDLQMQTRRWGIRGAIPRR
jgi:hypothetical protein